MVHVKCTSAPYYAEMTQIDGLEGTSLRSYHTVNHSDDEYKIDITNTFTSTGNTNNSTFNHNGSEYYYYAIASATLDSSSSGSPQIIFQTKYGVESQTTAYPKDTDTIINFTNIDIDKYNAYNSENGYFVAPHDMQIGVNAYSNIPYNASNATIRSYLAILTKDSEDVVKMMTRQSDIHDNNALGGSLSASAYISLKQGESMYASFKHFGTTSSISVSTE